MNELNAWLEGAAGLGELEEHLAAAASHLEKAGVFFRGIYDEKGDPGDARPEGLNFAGNSIEMVQALTLSIIQACFGEDGYADVRRRARLYQEMIDRHHETALHDPLTEWLMAAEHLPRQSD